MGAVERVRILAIRRVRRLASREISRIVNFRDLFLSLSPDCFTSLVDTRSFLLRGTHGVVRGVDREPVILALVSVRHFHKLLLDTLHVTTSAPDA